MMENNCLIKNPKELITRFNTGDTMAYQEVYNLFFEHMCYTVSGILGGKTAAGEDIVNDAFIKCWEKRGSFETLHKARCYIFVVAKHAAFHQLEKNKTRCKFETRYDQVHARQQGTVVEKLVYNEYLTCIYHEITLLPAKYKSLLELLFVEGLSTTQAAKVLKMNQDHLRVAKSRGLALLKNNIHTKYSWLFQ